MKNTILFYFLLCIALCNACTKAGSDDPNDPANIPPIVVPIGEMTMIIGGTVVRFRDDSGIFPEAVAGYTTSIGFLSIYRSVSLQDRRSLNIRITTIDLDKIKTPTDLTQNVKITYATFAGGQKTYDGQGSAIQFKLISKQNDLIQASFSGTLTNSLNTSDRVTITDGQLNVQIKRF